MSKKIRKIIGAMAIILMVSCQSNAIIVKAAEMKSETLESPVVDDTIKQYGNIQYKEVVQTNVHSSIKGQVGIEIQSILDNSDTITIPNTICGKNVIGFSNELFNLQDNFFHYIKNIKVVNNDPNNKLCAINFSSVRNLESLSFGDNIETIDNGSIANLDKLTAVTFPKSIKKIGGLNFFLCQNVETTNINECSDLDASVCCIDNTKWGNKMMDDNNGFLVINGQLLKCKNDDSKITIPEGVETICCNAFGYNYLLVVCKSKIQEINFPKSLKTIKTGAFQDALIGAVKIPNGVVVEENAFDKDTIIKGENDSITDIEKNYVFDKETGNIIAYLGDEKEVIIPSEINNVKVTGISSYGVLFRSDLCDGIFRTDTKVEKLIIPEGVTHIDDFALACAENLKEVTIPSSVETLGNRVFDGCKTLEKVVIKNDKINLLSCTLGSRINNNVQVISGLGENEKTYMVEPKTNISEEDENIDNKDNQTEEGENKENKDQSSDVNTDISTDGKDKGVNTADSNSFGYLIFSGLASVGSLLSIRRKQ